MVAATRKRARARIVPRRCGTRRASQPDAAALRTLHYPWTAHARPHPGTKPQTVRLL